jgi:TolB-like protein/class 3 adenylate cyclase/cytochrome c-type biogenesis protein CcmH/NrfG
MSADVKKEIELEIAHVLFLDIVGYSKLSVNEQHARVEELNEIVRLSEQYQKAEAAGRLIKIPTGDGMALVFYKSPEEPTQCAVEIGHALKDNARLRVRMGIHSGPVSGVVDVNERTNVAGAGINMAQRVMDCGDSGHILLSRHVAEDLSEYERWRPFLHDIGAFEVKHGVRVSVTNLYSDDVGNAQLPSKLQAVRKHRAHVHWAEAAIGLLVLAAIVAAFIYVLHSGSTRSLESIVKKSVAVLPFENLSDDKSNAYFAVGIQDEILTKLASFADLKVISRTSTTKYKSKPEDLKTVGQQLGVGTILEGSVQRAANKVRVNVQLIDARTDTHLWANTFDREMKDVFSVESEVASTIAQQLNAKLTGPERQAVAEKPTQIAAAYEAYLRGLGIEHGQFSDSSNQEAAAAYAEAVQLDPNFAVAWARLSLIQSFLYFNSIDKNTNSAAAVKDAADKAIALQPDLGEGWLAQGAYRYRILRNFPGALHAYNEAQKRLPNSALVNEYLAYVERRLGHWKQAEAHYLKAAELDPRDVQLWRSIAEELFQCERRYSEAQAALDRALQISPSDEGIIAAKADIFQEEGRLDEAAKQLGCLPKDSTDGYLILVRGYQAMFEHQFDTAVTVLEQKTKTIKPGQPVSTSDVVALVYQGYCQEWAGRPNDAHATFEFIIQALVPTPGSVITPDSRGIRSFLAMAYAGLADKQKALAEAKQAVVDYENDAVVTPQAELWLARIQARFKDFDSAIVTLTHSLEVPGGVTPGDLRFSPFWDPLRKDPRFEQIVASLAPKEPE